MSLLLPDRDEVTSAVQTWHSERVLGVWEGAVHAATLPSFQQCSQRLCSKQTALNIKVRRKGHSLIEFACGQQQTLPLATTLYMLIYPSFSPPLSWGGLLPGSDKSLTLIREIN